LPAKLVLVDLPNTKNPQWKGNLNLASQRRKKIRLFSL